MKPKLLVSLLIGLSILVLLSGCVRSPLGKIGNPEGQTTAAPTQPPPAATVPAAQSKPTITAPAAPSPDTAKAADDLSKMLDELTKDLNSADNLNDVK